MTLGHIGRHWYLLAHASAYWFTIMRSLFVIGIPENKIILLRFVVVPSYSPVIITPKVMALDTSLILWQY